jgi:hypothetical protein
MSGRPAAQALGLAVACGAHADHAVEPALRPGEEDDVAQQQQCDEPPQHGVCPPGCRRTLTSPLPIS